MMIGTNCWNCWRNVWDKENGNPVRVKKVWWYLRQPPVGRRIVEKTIQLAYDFMPWERTYPLKLRCGLEYGSVVCRITKGRLSIILQKGNFGKVNLYVEYECKKSDNSSGNVVNIY